MSLHYLNRQRSHPGCRGSRAQHRTLHQPGCNTIRPLRPDSAFAYHYHGRKRWPLHLRGRSAVPRRGPRRRSKPGISHHHPVSRWTPGGTILSPPQLTKNVCYSVQARGQAGSNRAATVRERYQAVRSLACLTAYGPQVRSKPRYLRDPYHSRTCVISPIY